MSEGRYFREALANFASEAAYAGAVRHLYDMGYSVEQIRKNLLYPVSVQQIESVIDEYRRRQNSPEADYEYVQDTDQYGKKSFRRIKKPKAGQGETRKPAGKETQERKFELMSKEGCLHTLL